MTRKKTGTPRETSVGPTQPELVLARQGDDPDPRLVELMRILARRAAREYYQRLTAKCPPKRP